MCPAGPQRSPLASFRWLPVSQWHRSSLRVIHTTATLLAAPLAFAPVLLVCLALCLLFCVARFIPSPPDMARNRLCPSALGRYPLSSAVHLPIVAALVSMPQSPYAAAAALNTLLTSTRLRWRWRQHLSSFAFDAVALLMLTLANRYTLLTTFIDLPPPLLRNSCNVARFT